MTGLMQTDPDGVMAQISNGFDWGYFEYNDAPAYVDDTTSTPDYQRAAWAVTQIERRIKYSPSSSPWASTVHISRTTVQSVSST